MAYQYPDHSTERKFEVAGSSAPKKISKIQFGNCNLVWLMLLHHIAIVEHYSCCPIASNAHKEHSFTISMKASAESFKMTTLTERLQRLISIVVRFDVFIEGVH